MRSGSQCAGVQAHWLQAGGHSPPPAAAEPAGGPLHQDHGAPSTGGELRLRRRKDRLFVFIFYFLWSKVDTPRSLGSPESAALPGSDSPGSAAVIRDRDRTGTGQGHFAGCSKAVVRRLAVKPPPPLPPWRIKRVKHLVAQTERKSRPGQQQQQLQLGITVRHNTDSPGEHTDMG